MEGPILLGLLLGLALVDSINPSALIATGFLLQRAPSGHKTQSVMAYVAGIFIFYFLTGVLLLAGFSFIVDELGNVFESKAAYVVQAIIGIALFAWSWIPPKPANDRLHAKNFKLPILFGLGVTVTLIEFVTAFPYLGAIALLQQAAMPFLSKLGLLLIYNLIFIVPPLALLAIYNLNKTRFTAWQASQAAKRNGKPSDTMQWIAGAVGILLFLHALSGLGWGNISIG